MPFPNSVLHTIHLDETSSTSNRFSTSPSPPPPPHSHNHNHTGFFSVNHEVWHGINPKRTQKCTNKNTHQNQPSQLHSNASNISKARHLRHNSSLPSHHALTRSSHSNGGGGGSSPGARRSQMGAHNLHTGVHRFVPSIKKEKISNMELGINMRLCRVRCLHVQAQPDREAPHTKRRHGEERDGPKEEECHVDGLIRGEVEPGRHREGHGHV